MPLGRQLHSSSDCIVVIVTPVVVRIMGISAVVARVEGVREMGVAKISSVIWCIWWRGISGKVCKGVASSNRGVWPAEPTPGNRLGAAVGTGKAPNGRFDSQETVYRVHR